MRAGNVGIALRLAVGGLAACGLAAGAMADSVTMMKVGYGEGLKARVTVNGSTFDTFVGQSLFKVSSGTGIGAAMTGIHKGFGLLPPTPTAPREIERTYALTGLGGAWGSLTADQSAAVRAVAGVAGNALRTSGEVSAAFQLALWEITTDYVPGQASSLSVSSGSFRASDLSGSMSTWLTAMFTAVGGAGTVGSGVVGASAPDTMAPTVIVQPETIPLPPAVWAGLAGLAAIAVARRRKLI